MKYLGYFVLVLLLSGCKCGWRDDCFTEQEVFFRVVDDAGNDLVFDLDVMPDSLHMQSTEGRGIHVEIQNERDKYLFAWLIPSIPTYRLSHEGRTTEITATFEQTGKGCCGPTYKLVEVTSANGKVSVVPTPSSPDGNVYVIEL